MSEPTGWVITDAERIVILERQLAEAQGKLDRIETEMCTCNRGLVGMCIAHDKNSLLARILKGE